MSSRKINCVFVEYLHILHRHFLFEISILIYMHKNACKLHINILGVLLQRIYHYLQGYEYFD